MRQLAMPIACQRAIGHSMRPTHHPHPHPHQHPCQCSPCPPPFTPSLPPPAPPLRLRGGSSTVFTSCKVFALSSRSVHAAIHTLRRHRPSTQASTDRSQPEPQPEPHPHPTTRHNPLDLDPFSTRPRHKLGTSSARPRLDLDSISARPAASTGVRRAARRPWRCLGWPHAWWPHAW